MENNTKKYTNGEITVAWKPDTCIHSANCWKGRNGLLSVFNPSKKPWINIDGAASERIIAQIKQCPSGALSFSYNNQKDEVKETLYTRIEVKVNGPLLVYGNISIKDGAGIEAQKTNVTAFCRCGQSNNKPYCDGTHVKVEFKG